jgi:hypothetical protein
VGCWHRYSRAMARSPSCCSACLLPGLSWHLWCLLMLRGGQVLARSQLGLRAPVGRERVLVAPGLGPMVLGLVLRVCMPAGCLLVFVRAEGSFAGPFVLPSFLAPHVLLCFMCWAWWAGVVGVPCAPHQHQGSPLSFGCCVVCFVCACGCDCASGCVRDWTLFVRVCVGRSLAS